MEFWIRNTLLQKFLQTDMIFFDQFKVPTIKFGNMLCGVHDTIFSHTFVEKIEKSVHLLPVCKLYPTLLALLSHTASSVAYEG